jgi:hypothetical protein
MCWGTSLGCVVLGYAAHRFVCKVTAVLCGNLRFSCLDIGGVVRIGAIGRVVASLFDADEIGAYLGTRQLGRGALRETQGGAGEGTNGEGEANERLHDQSPSVRTVVPREPGVCDGLVR